MKNTINIFGSQSGAIYLWLMLALLFLSLGIAKWSENYATLLQREKEHELLRIGLMYRDAIKSYYQNSPGSTKSYPEELKDLTRDPRYLEIRRYLRRLEHDPITLGEFAIIKNEMGQIVGVYSRSHKKPIKQKKFKQELRSFENAESYMDWKFMYLM